MKKILILCETQISTDKVAGDMILLLTKMPYLFQNISDQRVKVIPLENEKAVPAEATWALLDQINSILKSVIGGERSWVYEGKYHIEGSGLAQTCSDILGIMEIISQFFKQYAVDEVILYPTVDNVVECMLIEEISRRKRIKLKKCYDNILNCLVATNFGIISWLKYIRYLFLHKKKFDETLNKAQNNTIKGVQNYQLGMLHASNAEKSISWLSMWLFSMKEEFDTYRLCCLKAIKAAEYFRSKGVAVDVMEDWLTEGTLWNREKEYRKILGKSLKAISNTFHFFYENINITKTVRHFIYIHLLCDVPKALEIDSICFDYFKKNNFKVINSYGDSNFSETRALYYATRGARTTLFRSEGLLLYDTPRYEPYQNMIRIRFFCKGSVRYNELTAHGWNGQAYFTGSTEYVSKFKERYENEQRVMRIPKKVEILWAPSYVVRGYTTYNTFRNNNIRILQQFKENKWKLYVKFHPNQMECQVKELYEQYANCENIQFVDKNESVYNWIEKVDIIITDKSMLIFDSITAGKPVMVLCSPLHYSMVKSHSEGVCIFQSIEDMFTELYNIENDWNYYQQWRDDTVTRQDTYFKRYIQDGDPIKDMARILKRACKI